MRRAVGALLAAALVSCSGAAVRGDDDAATGEQAMFGLSGRRPADLGVRNGRFTAAPTWKPNWVSSQVAPDDPHYVAPFAVTGDGRQAVDRLVQFIASQPRARIVAQRDGYVHAEFTTPLMGYVDDVELFRDGSVLHVRSSSRLGVRDFGVNRKRVEALRAALGN